MKQRKWLIRCGQNGNESRKEVGQCSFVIDVLSALEWASNLIFYATYGTGEACISPSGESNLRRLPMGMQVKEAGESQGCIVMMQIQTMSGTKVSPLPAGLPLQDDLKNFIKGKRK